MKKKKTNPAKSNGRQKSEELRDSRRGFFKDAVLGAGGLAFTAVAAGAVTGCDDNSSSNSSSGGSVGSGTPTGVSQETDPNEWFEPKEFDLTRRAGLKGINLQAGDGSRILENIHQLDVDYNTTGASTGQSKDLFAYNGTVPGPTFRLRGDQNLSVAFSNSLPANDGAFAVLQGSLKVMNDKPLPDDTLDWQIDHHLYGPHQQHVSNLHTHGLHVSPGIDYQSQDKTQQSIHSDNVLLRVIPYGDYEKRVLEGNGPALLDNEQVERAMYNFKLPRPDGTPHYPGTHWYHPHPHGATYDQVASGMAGFLIVEGPVDDYLAALYSRSGYIELPLLIQRIFAPLPSESEDPLDVKKGNQKKTTVTIPSVNGQAVNNGGSLPQRTVVRGQVIRLRVLNGSVDGQGYIRFMVVKGTQAPALIDPNAALYTPNIPTNPTNASQSAKRWRQGETNRDNRICLNNIAYDGINLINSQGEYANMPAEWVTIGIANRADFLINIPTESEDGDVYTIWAQDMTEAVDQDKTGGEYNLKVAQFTVVLGTPVKAPELNPDGSLKISWESDGTRMKVQSMLMPIDDDEVTISSNSETTEAYLPSDPKNLDGTPLPPFSNNNNAGKVRSRRVLYSGFGHNSVAASAFDPNITLGGPVGVKGNTTHTVFNAMVIDGKKYGADTSSHQGWDTAQHKMQVNTAEEWSIYNYSMTSYLNDSTQSNTDTSNYTMGKSPYQNPATGPNALKRTKAVHHPFHIHQNPFFVKSIQDSMGRELLPLDDNGKPIPRWQDTVYIPHNGGRVIMRSRFWDYTGKYVNHCHLLQHEDWGMMQAVEVVDGSSSNRPNYIPLPKEDAFKQNVFPPLSIKQMFTLDIGKVSETLTQNDATNPLKMLCYDPGTTSFFNQRPVTTLEAKPVDPSYYTSNDNQSINEANLGYLIIPVPEPSEAFPAWNNNIQNGSLP